MILIALITETKLAAHPKMKEGERDKGHFFPPPQNRTIAADAFFATFWSSIANEQFFALRRLLRANKTTGTGRDISAVEKVGKRTREKWVKRPSIESLKKRPDHFSDWQTVELANNNPGLLRDRASRGLFTPLDRGFLRQCDRKLLETNKAFILLCLTFPVVDNQASCQLSSCICVTQ